jgi:hypothetical protein
LKGEILLAIRSNIFGRFDWNRGGAKTVKSNDSFDEIPFIPKRITVT